MGNWARRLVMGLVAMLLPIAGARGELTGLDYPSFGVSLIGPGGWVGEIPCCKFVVARWERQEQATGALEARVEVRALPGAGMTLRQFADVLGKQIGGKVVDQGMKVDGVPAWRMEGNTGEGFVVRGAIVAEHEGVMYVIQGSARPGEQWLPAAREVMEKWKWIAVETPAKRMRYLEGWALVLHGLVRISLPVGMGVAEADKSWNESADSVSLGLCNYKKGGDDLMMTASVQTLEAGESIEGFRERLRQSLQGQWKKGMDWHAVPEWTRKMETDLVEVSKGVYEEYACAETGADQRAVVLRFRIATEDEEDQAFYARQVAYMIREFSVVQKMTAEGRGP